MTASDILVIGGGIAGLSAAAALAEHANVTVLEAEEQIGFHASGRSATMLHYALGNPLIRRLTRVSRAFFESPPEGFSDAPLTAPLPILVHAQEAERADLEQLEQDLAPFTAFERLDADGLERECPVLKVGSGASEHGLIDHTALKLDGHALLQGYARSLRRRGGGLHANARIASVRRSGSGWRVETERGELFEAAVLVNAAGAWADDVARMAGVEPLGLEPRRRTIIVFDAPESLDVARLPFTKTVNDELYFGPEAGRIFASPMDEVAAEPCDAQPEEYEMALAAQRIEERTTMRVRRIEHRWAGLRTFAPDRLPVVGFAPGADGFFWLAGQGGAGLQTSPAIARIVESLLTGSRWPVDGVAAEELSPVRFTG